MNAKAVDVLLVEDNPADAIILKKIFSGAKTPCRIRVAEDGVVAMALLNSDEEPKPDIILLDINMPKKDGKQVLKELKSDDNLKHIPVIMLTSSSSRLDIMECYALSASSYVLKPSSVGDHEKLLRAFDAFWFDFALLPEQGEVV